MRSTRARTVRLSTTNSPTAWSSWPRRCRASSRPPSPCSCPPGAAYEPEGLGGTASMLAEWITRGAGDLDSRELLTALDNLGRQPRRGGPDAPHQRLGRDPGPEPDPRPGDLRRRPPPPPPRRRGGRADPGPGPPEPPGPGGRPRLEGHLRAAAPPLPRPLGPPLARARPRGSRRPRPTTSGPSTGPHYRPNGAILAVAGAIDWPALKDAVGRLFGDWEPRPEPAVADPARRPGRDHILKETQQTQIALAYPDRHRRQPRLLPGPGR